MRFPPPFVFTLGQVFRAVAAIDTLLLLVFLVLTLNDPAGRHDGGRAMGLFFFIMVPAAVLGLAMLIFSYSTWVPLRWLALFVVTVPGLWFVKVQIDDKVIDMRLEANRLGVGYFDAEPMRQLGSAVVRRDVDTLMRIGRTVDVNTPGRDMTLMRLAVSGPDARTSDGSELPVVRTLLALGARPDDAMEVACIRADPTLLEILLAAGGRPDMTTDAGEPLVFSRMSSLTPDNFRRLVRHGLDLNSRSHGSPLPVQLAIYQRWDLLAIAIELGADTRATRADGRNVADELAGQWADATGAGRNVPTDLLRARAALDAWRQAR